MNRTTHPSDVTTGIDLSDMHNQAVVLDAGGEPLEERSIPTTREAFERDFAESAGASW